MAKAGWMVRRRGRFESNFPVLHGIGSQRASGLVGAVAAYPTVRFYHQSLESSCFPDSLLLQTWKYLMSGDCDFGLIGLAVMGENLALNVESRGYKVAVFNRTTEKVDELISGRAAGKNFVGTHSIEEFVKAVKRPRKLMMLVKAGPAVDAIIDQLVPLCEPGDIIIDGGNTHYVDTERRTKAVEQAGLLFVGCGVSGGEEGALLGPSLMPGGSPGRLARNQRDVPGDIRQGRPEQRYPMLRMGWRARRRPLRKNGS